MADASDVIDRPEGRARVLGIRIHRALPTCNGIEWRLGFFDDAFGHFENADFTVSNGPDGDVAIIVPVIPIHFYVEHQCRVLYIFACDLLLLCEFLLHILPEQLWEGIDPEDNVMFALDHPHDEFMIETEHRIDTYQLIVLLFMKSIDDQIAVVCKRNGCLDSLGRQQLGLETEESRQKREIGVISFCIRDGRD